MMSRQEIENERKSRTYVIRLEDGRFYMDCPDGSVVAGGTPRKLAKVAWEKGAWQVVYDFDLNLDPDK